jgi:hypothetical protein
MWQVSIEVQACWMNVPVTLNLLSVAVTERVCALGDRRA